MKAQVLSEDTCGASMGHPVVYDGDDLSLNEAALPEADVSRKIFCKITFHV